MNREQLRAEPDPHGCKVILYTGPQGARLATPSFTVLVCTRDRPAELERCLESVSRLDFPRFELLVVDSAPRHFPAEGLARRFGATYIHEATPGVSRARNIGALACTTELLAILDDEAVADPGWLRGLEVEFEDPLVMGVAGRILDTEPRTQEERLCAALGGHDRGELRRVVDRDEPLWFERTLFGGVGTGGNLAFRRTAFDKWPGFTECLGAGTPVCGAEEHFAFFSLVKSGWRVVYCPEARVTHPYPRTLPELKARRLRNLGASVGYFLFLFSELHRYRGRLIQYALEGARGAARPWRGGAGMPPVRLYSRWEGLAAILRGLRAYVAMRRGGYVSGGRLSVPAARRAEGGESAA